MSQAKVSEWINYLLPILHESLSNLRVIPQRGDVVNIKDKHDFILCDVTERQVYRSTCYKTQKEYYSGKKKTHTVKNLAFSDKDGYIIFLSETYEGTVHDKAILDEIRINIGEENILMDLGFQGAEKKYPNVITPFKKPKNKELSQLQKEINKQISSLRVRIEHAFSSIKRLKVVQEKIRLKTAEIRDKIMTIATALHNFRMKCRS